MLKMNLQLFAGEKTEKATEKKKRDARKKGQVVLSRDINSAFSLLFVLIAIQLFKGYVANGLFVFFDHIAEMMGSPAQYFNVNGMRLLLQDSIFLILTLSIPFLGVAMVTGVLFSYFQVGFLFTMEPLKLKLDKLSPAKGFKRLFSLRSFVEFIKSFSKAAMVVYIAYSYIVDNTHMLLNLYYMSFEDIMSVLWSLVYNIGIRISALLVVLGILDFGYKKWQNAKDLRMSKQEIKDEYKTTEGDPQLKAKIKEKQRQISMSRMMQEVPKADVVITNPTHYAIAIQYDASKYSAPRVVAKGQNLIAENIKKKAKEAEVPVVENKPLARSLYAAVEIGDLVPEDLFQAVAEVLAYVYKIKKNR